MEKEVFYNILEHPFLLSEKEKEEVKELLKKFPFFETLHILYLQNSYGEEKYERLLQKSGIHISSPRYYYKNLMLNKMYQGYKKEEKVNDENIEEENKTKEESLIYAPSFYKIEEKKKNIFDIQKDSYNFTDWLNAIENSNSTTSVPSQNVNAQKTAKTISQFISKDIKKDKKNYNNEKKEIEKKEYKPEQLMSQTLAEIYVKQQLYDRAISIYEKLDLNSSEKNTTFAERIKEINELKNN